MKIKFIIPNLITGASLISGLAALHYTFESEFYIAAWLIALSMVCDGLDGKVARLLKAQSQFGAQFDTLSDFVAFGVVPGFLVYKAVLFQFNIIGAIMAIFYVFSGGYRLVRFSLKNHLSNTKEPFIGLPIPAAAGMISSFIIFNFYTWNKINYPDIFMIITFISSFLMISKIEYLPLEKGKKLTKESKFFITLAFVSMIAAVKYSYFIFGLWIMLYILYGIIRQGIIFYKKINRKI